jgi:hypothetical protein
VLPVPRRLVAETPTKRGSASLFKSVEASPFNTCKGGNFIRRCRQWEKIRLFLPAPNASREIISQPKTRKTIRTDLK